MVFYSLIGYERKEVNKEVKYLLRVEREHSIDGAEKIKTTHDYFGNGEKWVIMPDSKPVSERIITYLLKEFQKFVEKEEKKRMN